MRRVNRGLLVIVMLVLSATLFLMTLGAETVPADDFETKRKAAGIMQACMDGIKQYKLELGIDLSEGDIHQTGLIGDEFTSITTTVGVLEAKRTVANADMAALAVQMLTEVGVARGETVGATFSGSFPGMNLAFLAAAEAMDLDLVYIASVGASMYGANQPTLTFPDMLQYLLEDGLLSQAPSALSMGGDGDSGLEMDPQIAQEIRGRLEGYGYPFLYIEDYWDNIERRAAIYDAHGIRCLIGVGGNLTTTGRGEDTLPYGVIQPYKVKTTDENSGLLEIYNARGLPVIHILNIKELVTGYGLAYDPLTLPETGTSAIYFHTRYRWPIAAAGICISVAILIISLYKRKRMEKKS